MEFKLYKILQVPLFYNVQVFGFLVSQLPWPPSKDRPRTGLRAPWQDRRVRRRCPRLPEAVVVWRKRFRGFFLVKNKTSSDTVLTSYEKTQPPPQLENTCGTPRRPSARTPGGNRIRPSVHLSLVDQGTYLTEF